MYLKRLREKKLLIDKVLYPLAIIAPLFTIPQFYEVWFRRQTIGVSSLSWFLMGIMAFVWFIHATQHKDKILQLNTALMIFFNFSIFIGVLVFSK